jgi:hypothetical protein
MVDQTLRCCCMHHVQQGAKTPCGLQAKAIRKSWPQLPQRARTTPLATNPFSKQDQQYCANRLENTYAIPSEYHCAQIHRSRAF